MAAKRRRTVLSIEKKLEIISRIMENHESVTKVAAEFGIGNQTVRDLINRKDTIIEYASTIDGKVLKSTRKTLKKATMAKHDEKVLSWFMAQRAEGIAISGHMLREKAFCVYREMKIKEPFCASKGWLDKFKRRHGIKATSTLVENRNKEQLPEATIYNDELDTFILKEHLTAEQIYNFSDFKLLWNTFPIRTLDLVASMESNCNEKITIMLCSNATGSHKLKIATVGCSPKPKFSGETPTFIYYQHTEALITECIFKIWFFNEFVPSVRKHLIENQLPSKAVLLLSSAHCQIFGTSNLKFITNDGEIFVRYIPAMFAKIIEPMEQGIKTFVKCQYQIKLLNFIRKDIQSESIDESLNSWKFKYALQAICYGWNKLSKATLKRSWLRILDPDSDCDDLEDHESDDSGKKDNNNEDDSDDNTKTDELLEWLTETSDKICKAQ